MRSANGLKEMPKVGDKVRYVGSYCGFLTQGKEYEVIGIVDDLFEFEDDDGDMLDDDMSDWEIVETRPDTAALIANLARRVSDLEAENKQQAYEINTLYRAFAEREARL